MKCVRNLYNIFVICKAHESSKWALEILSRCLPTSERSTIERLMAKLNSGNRRIFHLAESISDSHTLIEWYQKMKSFVLVSRRRAAMEHGPRAKLWRPSASWTINFNLNTLIKLECSKTFHYLIVMIHDSWSIEIRHLWTLGDCGLCRWTQLNFIS